MNKVFFFFFRFVYKFNFESACFVVAFPRKKPAVEDLSDRLLIARDRTEKASRKSARGVSEGRLLIEKTKIRLDCFPIAGRSSIFLFIDSQTSERRAIKSNFP